VRPGDVVRRTRTVRARDIELFTRITGDRNPVRPDDTLTAEVEVLSVREDKPVSTLRTTNTNQAGVVVLDGTAVVWRDPVVAAASAPPTTDFPGR
jgi:acyl dehydratase